MLSYLHAFHAGNFADVQKHAGLYLCLTMMQAKASPIACFDTHAGSADYDLAGERARKTAEADTGIQAVWRRRGQLGAPDWAGFLAILERLNGDGPGLQRYPGSPAWMQALARPEDTVTAFELHSTEGAQLTRWAESRGVRVRQEDGLQGLLRALPPAQPRLCVLIDPSYEIRSDYQAVAQTLIKAWQRCRHGVFLVWYPILPDRPHEGLLSALAASPVRKTLRSELMLAEPPPRGMQGSGLLVVNPPWGFDTRLEAMLAEAGSTDILNARHHLDWWLPE